MYESPIVVTERIVNQIREDVENKIMEYVCSVGVNVDEEELIRALEYDRGQYEKGYHDAMLNRMPLLEAVETIEEFYNSCQDGIGPVIVTPDGVMLQTDWGYFEEGLAEIKRYARG